MLTSIDWFFAYYFQSINYLWYEAFYHIDYEIMRMYALGNQNWISYPLLFINFFNASFRWYPLLVTIHAVHISGFALHVTQVKAFIKSSKKMHSLMLLGNCMSRKYFNLFLVYHDNTCYCWLNCFPSAFAKWVGNSFKNNTPTRW